MTNAKQVVVGPVEFQGQVQFDQPIIYGTNVGAIHMSGVPSYLSATSFSLSHVNESNISGTVNNPVLTVVSMSVVGLNGIDTGSVGANEFWYLYAIAKPDSTGPGLIMSQTNELLGGTISTPSGYVGGAKIQMPFALMTDGSNAIRPFAVVYGWPSQPYVQYTNELVVLASGVSTTLAPFPNYTPTVASATSFFYTINYSTPGNTGSSVITTEDDFLGGVRNLGYETTTSSITKQDLYFHGVIPSSTMYYQVGGANESLSIQVEGFFVDTVP